MMTMREQIVEEARKYLGVRFRHQGRTVAGIDCAGLILNVGNDLGLIEYSETGYDSTWRERIVNVYKFAGVKD
jgi:cell wall-associated NlpC family hydrolase